MNRKSFTPMDLSLSEDGSVVVAFSRLNVIDKDRDVTLPGAIPTKAVAMSDFGHRSWDGYPPIGRGEVKESGDLGVFTGTFLMSTSQGQNAYHTVKGMGDLQEWSYGYTVLDSAPGQKDGQSVNFLKSLDIYEISPVLVGAGVGTGTLAIKSGRPGTDAPYSEHASWVQDVVAEFLQRTKDRTEWRAKEGRVLSAANHQALLGIHEGMLAMAGDLRTMLDAMNPPKGQRRIEIERTSLLIEIERARSLGSI